MVDPWHVGPSSKRRCGHSQPLGEKFILETEKACPALSLSPCTAGMALGLPSNRGCDPRLLGEEVAVTQAKVVARAVGQALLWNHLSTHQAALSTQTGTSPSSAPWGSLERS